MGFGSIELMEWERNCIEQELKELESRFDYKSKLTEYERLLDFNNEYFSKDFKSNLKFIKSIVSDFEKKNKNNKIDNWKQEVYEFLVMAIKVHKENYILN